MQLGVVLGGVLTSVALLGVFLVILYRMSGIKPAALERRRLTVLLAMLTGFAIVLGALFSVRAPGVQFYAVGFAVAVYLATRELQKRGHWLVTPTAAEQAAMPARREAVAATTRRPAFWLLVAGIVAGILMLNLTAILAFR